MLKINDLVDDCIILIFVQLPIMDRIRIERVCKRWQELSKLSWTSFKKLDISSKTWKSDDKKNPWKPLYINNEIINKVIKINGKYLTTINLCRTKEVIKYDTGLDLETFKNICTNCPNIQEFLPLNICELLECNSRQKCTKSKHMIVPWLMPLCKNFKKIWINMMSICDSHDDISLLFSRMTNLKSICIQSYWTDGKADFLLHLPLETMEEITFIDVNFSRQTVNILDTMMKKSVHLHTVVFQSFKNRYDDSIIRALLYQKKLKNLKIDDCEAVDTYENFTNYIMLSHQLVVLELKWCRFVNNDLLTTISKYCVNLKKLDITGCKAVNDVGILNISALKGLRCLVINNVSNVTYLPSKELVHLETLCASYCYNLVCASICDLIRLSPNLRYLNVRYGRIFVNALIITAIDAVNIRKTNKNLTLKLEVHIIDASLFKVINATPLLEVSGFKKYDPKKGKPYCLKPSSSNFSNCKIQ